MLLLKFGLGSWGNLTLSEIGAVLRQQWAPSPSAGMELSIQSKYPLQCSCLAVFESESIIENTLKHVTD